MSIKPRKEGWREFTYTIIFGVDTPGGLIFDVALLAAILASVVLVSLETVESISQETRRVMYIIEWVLTVAFTIEYILRLMVVRPARRYALSFLGIVDVVSLLPTYVAFFVGEHFGALRIIRAFRLLRVFRVFQLGPFVREGNALIESIRKARYKIGVFLGTLLIIVVIQGALLYFVESTQPNTQFESIPISVYWAIVTLTTVGYGDVAPQTGIGRTIAAMLMLFGYGVIAVPTGIVTAEMAKGGGAGDSENGDGAALRICAGCDYEEPDATANFCRSCGKALPVDDESELTKG